MLLKLAKLSEYDVFYKLKCEDNNLYWTGWKNEPNYETLKDYYITCISNIRTIKDRRIYLAHENANIIGYVYIDYVNDDTFAISPAISSKYQKKGYGKEIVRLAINEGLRLGYKNMEAYIREDNIASQKCFEYNGAFKTNISKKTYIENINKDIMMIKYYYETK